MLLEKVGVAFMAGWLLNHTRPSRVPPPTLSIPSRPLFPPFSAVQLLAYQQPENVVQGPGIHFATNYINGNGGSSDRQAMDQIESRQASSSTEENDEDNEEHYIQPSSPFMPPPMPFEDEGEDRETFDKQYRQEDEEGKKDEQDDFSQKEQPEKTKKKPKGKKKAKKRKRKSGKPSIAAPLEMASLIHPQIIAPPMPSSPPMFSPYQFYSPHGYAWPHPSPIIIPPPRRKLIFPSALKPLAIPPPNLSSQASGRRLKIFPNLRKRTGSHGTVISGHAQDNISFKKSFKVKFFQIPFMSVDVDRKVYQDESMSADLGKRMGAQATYKNRN